VLGNFTPKKGRSSLLPITSAHDPALFFLGGHLLRRRPYERDGDL